MSRDFGFRISDFGWFLRAANFCACAQLTRENRFRISEFGFSVVSYAPLTFAPVTRYPHMDFGFRISVVSCAPLTFAPVHNPPDIRNPKSEILLLPFAFFC